MRWPRLPPSYSVSELVGSSDESSLKPVLYGVDEKRTSSNTKNSASGPKKTVSPTPIDFTIASAFLAMPRGSRLYGSPVVGSSTSQTSTRVVSAKNGSMQAEFGSGIRHMSDSLIAFQPAIDEPSNIWPSENVSSSIMPMSKVKCCHLPRGSVKRKSAYLTSLSLMSFRTSLAVVIDYLPLVSRRSPIGEAAPGSLYRVQSGLSGPDANGFLYLGDENLSIANASGLGGAADGVHRLVDHFVGKDDLDFHL